MSRTLLLCLLAALAACRKDAPPAPKAAEADEAQALEPGTLRVSEKAQKAAGIEVYIVKSGALPEQVRVTGVLDYPREQALVPVAAPSAGTVTKVSVSVGDSVRPGQALLELDGKAIEAPAYGAVADLQVSAGSPVRQGQALASLLSSSRLSAYLDVRESQLAKVRPGQAAEVRVLSMPGPPLRGRIASFSPQMDPQTRTVTARVDLENKGGALRPGMAVEASVEAPGSRQGIAVPASAVLYDASGGTWVYVLGDPELFARRRVDLAPSTLAGRRVVVRGLEPGELLVVRGAQSLWGKEYSSELKVGDDDDEEPAGGGEGPAEKADDD